MNANDFFDVSTPLPNLSNLHIAQQEHNDEEEPNFIHEVAFYVKGRKIDSYIFEDEIEASAFFEKLLRQRFHDTKLAATSRLQFEVLKRRHNRAKQAEYKRHGEFVIQQDYNSFRLSISSKYYGIWGPRNIYQVKIVIRQSHKKNNRSIEIVPYNRNDIEMFSAIAPKTYRKKRFSGRRTG